MNTLSAEKYLKNVSYKKSIGDFCYHYYNFFIKDVSEEQALNNFIRFLKWDKDSEESIELEKILSEDDYEQTTNEVAPIVKKILDNLIIKNLKEREFYNALMKKIQDNIIFSEKETVCSMVILLIEKRIPYFELEEAKKMEEQEFQNISKSIENDIKKAYFIMEYGYDQKTEVASQLYRLIEEQKDEKQKYVLLSNILGYFEEKIEYLISNIISEDDCDEEDS